MSSVMVRDAIEGFLQSNSSEKVVILDGEYAEFQDVLDGQGVGTEDKFIALSYIGGDETPISVGANNSSGKYRESGVIYVHIVDIASMGIRDSLLTRGETLRDLFRGRRIGSVLIESVTPVNFESGAALRFEDGYMSCAFMMGYQADLDL